LKPFPIESLRLVASHIRHSRGPMGVYSFYYSFDFCRASTAPFAFFVCCYAFFPLWMCRIPISHSQLLVTAFVQVVFRFDSLFPRLFHEGQGMSYSARLCPLLLIALIHEAAVTFCGCYYYFFSKDSEIVQAKPAFSFVSLGTNHVYLTPYNCLHRQC